MVDAKFEPSSVSTAAMGCARDSMCVNDFTASDTWISDRTVWGRVTIMVGDKRSVVCDTLADAEVLPCGVTIGTPGRTGTDADMRVREAMDADVDSRDWVDNACELVNTGCVRGSDGCVRCGVAAGCCMTSFAVGNREKERDRDKDRLGSNWNASLADRDKDNSASDRSESVGP